MRLTALGSLQRLRACSDQLSDDSARADGADRLTGLPGQPYVVGIELHRQRGYVPFDFPLRTHRMPRPGRSRNAVRPPSRAHAGGREYSQFMGGMSDYEAKFEARLSPRELEQWRQMKAESPPVEPAEALRLRRRREAWERAAREYVDGATTAAELVERAGSGT